MYVYMYMYIYIHSTYIICTIYIYDTFNICLNPHLAIPTSPRTKGFTAPPSTGHAGCESGFDRGFHPLAMAVKNHILTYIVNIYQPSTSGFIFKLLL